MSKKRKLQQQGPRAKGQQQSARNAPGPGRKAGGQLPSRTAASAPSQGKAKGGANKPLQQQQQQQQNQRPTIPFSPSDSILLVGEGDLSFARSLVEHHGCVDLTATVLEKDLEELVEKYPHVAENFEAVQSVYSTLSADSGGDGGSGCDSDGNSDASGGAKSNNRVLFGFDARKMGPLPSGDRQRGGGGGNKKNRIIFNFPHVGGKSTDVNRQVRYNQELLVDFFRSAEQRCLAPGGTVVVTLFEGEPYTLWNVRDLARHSGLQLERSFAFRADAYPGYRHARTLGVVRSSKTGEAAAAAWRGEERPARSYVFYRKGEIPPPPPSKKKKRKRAGGGGDDDDDDSDDNDNENASDD